MTSQVMPKILLTLFETISVSSTHIWALCGHCEGAAELHGLARAHGAAGWAGPQTPVVLDTAELHRERHSEGAHLKLKHGAVSSQHQHRKINSNQIPNAINLRHRGKYFERNVWFLVPMLCFSHFYFPEPINSILLITYNDITNPPAA